MIVVQNSMEELLTPVPCLKVGHHGGTKQFSLKGNKNILTFYHEPIVDRQSDLVSLPIDVHVVQTASMENEDGAMPLLFLGENSANRLRTDNVNGGQKTRTKANDCNIIWTIEQIKINISNAINTKECLICELTLNTLLGTSRIRHFAKQQHAASATSWGDT